MPADLRRARILEAIERHGGASVGELAREHGVSPITVHRDLERLARDGLVERVRGGARRAGSDPTRIRVATDWTKRLRQATREKEAIAARAAEHVEDGSTIFVDSSTTCLALARHLERRPPRALTLVTNSPAIALELHADSIHVIVTPGEVDQTLRMIGGRWATEFLAGINMEVAFVSAGGITLEHGLTTTRRALADTLQAAATSAAKTIGLIDSSKFGLAALLSIARVEDLDALIVDEGLPPETAAAYEAAGVNLVVAEPERRALSQTA
ncbi:MAG TPA: DeoR/GlpR family DNA-binding transcription regulator [Gaiellaceae bacterium]|nr:DeoR/GlpR family DNA-binding transcription regulator [Gaiellaceae bacterium]